MTEHWALGIPLVVSSQEFQLLPLSHSLPTVMCVSLSAQRTMDNTEKNDGQSQKIWVGFEIMSPSDFSSYTQKSP